MVVAQTERVEEECITLDMTERNIHFNLALGAEFCKKRAQNSDFIFASLQPSAATQIISHSSVCSYAAAVDLAKTAWVQCSLLMPKHPLHLPPCHITDDLSDLLVNAICFLRGMRQKLDGAGGNILVHGVAGVGKTTFLKAVAIFGLLLFDVFTVYWDYEQLPMVAPTAIIRPFLELLHQSMKSESAPPIPTLAFEFPSKRYTSALNGVDEERLNDLGLSGLVFLGDEVNRLYVDESHPCRPQSIVCVANLLALAKTCQSGIIVSGSAANVKELAFREGTCLVTALNYRTVSADYLSLNHSVTEAKTLYPIRSLTECLKFAAQYDAMVPQVHSVVRPTDTMTPAADREQRHHSRKQLFNRTGGVIRTMLAVLHGRTIDMEGAVRDMLMGKDGDTAFVLFATMMWSRFAPKLISRIVCEESGHVEFALSSTDVIPALEQDEVLAALKITRGHLTHWENQSCILLRHGNIEILVPQALCAIARKCEAQFGLSVTGLVVTLHGWCNGSSAVAAAEPFVSLHVCRPWLNNRFGLKSSISEHCWLMDQANLFSKQPLWPRAGKGERTSDPESPQLHQLISSLILTTSDSGLDGFVLLYPPREPGDDEMRLDGSYTHPMIHVVGVRMKLGRADNTIKLGHLPTQRSHVLLGQTVDESTVAGIVANAERAWKGHSDTDWSSGDLPFSPPTTQLRYTSLSSCLHRRLLELFPTYQFAFVELALFTSKQMLPTEAEMVDMMRDVPFSLSTVHGSEFCSYLPPHISRLYIS